MYIRDSYEIHFYFRYDAVTVYDGLKETDNELGNFCGSDVRDHFLEYVSFFMNRFASNMQQPLSR